MYIYDLMSQWFIIIAVMLGGGPPDYIAIPVSSEKECLERISGPGRPWIEAGCFERKKKKREG